LRQKLEKITSQLSIQDRVIFLGAKDHEDVQKEMSHADIFVLTSITSSNGDQEGLPVGLIEAQAMGLPAVSSKHAGIPELVSHKESGYLAEEKNVDQIARYLSTLISNDKLRAEFSLNARNITRENFNIEILNDRLASYLTRKVRKFDSQKKHSQCHNQPSVSIVIPTYNRPEYLKQSIESALSQDLQCTNCEILIISDGYDEETEKVVKGYSTKHIRFIQKEHSGAVHSRNLAIDEAKGDYILWLDDDDILEPTTLTSHLETLFDHPDADVVYGILEYFDDKTGNTLRYFDPSDWSDKPNELAAALTGGCRIPNPATLIRKSAYQLVGKYDPDFKRAHDFEFWSRAAESLTFKKNNSIVCRYRVHADNMSVGEGIDYSYESLIIRKMVSRYGIQRLFHCLDWRDPKVSESVAKYIVARNLFRFGDYHNCTAILSQIPRDLVSKEIIKLHFYCSIFQGIKRNYSIESALNDKNNKRKYDRFKTLNKKLRISIKGEHIRKCVQDIIEYRKHKLAPPINLLVQAGNLFLARGEVQKAKQVFAQACMINPRTIAETDHR
jgi:glycosyltransferase involved in cell wall biosynthesis